ncbi:MAG: hypothetical protein M1820_010369 [Bogoriella megaspora]|nr:MAG: hypothetical protein M1820_010369 [Bogoriella megaspora]
MATEQPPVPINGNYAPQQTQGFGAADLNSSYNPSAAAATGYGDAVPAATGTANTTNGGSSDLGSDEVGWYFVERYYTTLSRQPEKLFLFYQKRSQFVSGVEAEKVSVCVGQKAINDRIKELDIQECKVRVTNVDSQSSDNSIVIQVIGEISNKSAPHRKFTQTFVLARQTNGYFVLNDIFRYILEDEEYEANAEEEELQQNQAVPSGHQEPVPSTEETEPKTMTSSDDPVALEIDATMVDKEIEEKILKDEIVQEQEVPPAVDVNGILDDTDNIEHAEDAPAAAVSQVQEDVAPVPEEPEVPATVADVEPEKPKDPEPTPVTATPIAAPPAAPPKPAAPKTWATLAAAANQRIAPATPAVRTTPPATNQTKVTPPAQTPASNAPAAAAAAAAPAALATTGSTTEAQPAPSPQDDWQPVGGDHNKRQARAQAPATEQQNSRAYIKNVYENVDPEELRKVLAQHGEIVYFDVSRQKNCAFVDFATPAGYQAAVAANPHTVGNNRIFVEERRLRPGSYPYVPRGRGDMRGGRGGTGPRDGGRGGGYQQKPAFPPRGGRGGANAGARGRGAGQAA